MRIVSVSRIAGKCFPVRKRLSTGITKQLPGNQKTSGTGHDYTFLVGLPVLVSVTRLLNHG
jgi:hypothetical protein